MDLVALFLGMDDHLARFAQVFQLVGQQVKPWRPAYSSTARRRPTRPRHRPARKPEPIAPCVRNFSTRVDRQVVDQPRLGAVGHDGQIIARDDDPVPAQITFKERSLVVESRTGTPLSCWFSSSSFTSPGTGSWIIVVDAHFLTGQNQT